MTIVLWFFQLALTLLFFLAGMVKAFQYEKARSSMDWVSDVPEGLVIFIGYVEVLGALGLILPTALNILPILTVIAAFGLATIMLFASVFHYTRKEFQGIPMNVIILLIALFIGFGHLYLS